jgi:hypothetical protein
MSTLMLRLTLLTALLLMSVLPVGLPAPRAAHAVTPPPPGSWPFYRYDMQRTNRVPSSVAKGNITQPAIKWSFPVGGAAAATAADITGPNGTPDGVPEIIAWGSGRVRAYNSQTGDLIWISELFLGTSVGVSYAGDVDGDGSAEVLVYVASGSRWRLLALRGDTGAVRSQIAGNIADPAGVAIVDADGDNKLEVIEAGYDDSDRSVFTYKLGADNPQLIRNDLPDRARVIHYGSVRYGVADLNGDGSREVVLGGDLYASDPGKQLFYIYDGITWVTHTTYLPGWVGAADIYPTLLVTDILASAAGEEIFVTFSSYNGYNVAHAGLYTYSASHAVTEQWVLTRTGAADDTALYSVAINPGGLGDRVLAWSYQNTTQQWRTELLNASNGAVIATLNDHWLCLGRGSAAQRWR